MDDDDVLLDRLAEDLNAGYADLVRTYASTVYSVLLRQCGVPAEADDLGQDTFLRAYTALKGYSPQRRRELRLRAWLVTIAVNVWRSHLRTVSRRPVTVGRSPEHLLELVDSADVRPGPAELAALAHDRSVLAEALGGLPERYRLAVVLRHVAGLDYAEIASVLDCPVGTAKAQVSRGLEKLRQLLAGRVKELTA